MERGERGDWRVAGFVVVVVVDALMLLLDDDDEDGGGGLVAAAAEICWNSVSISVDLGRCDV